MDEIGIFLAIHVVVPAMGVHEYLRLCRTMRDATVPDPPCAWLFVLFATYGGALLVVLTALCWTWSGMASLGLFYLLLGAPVALGACVATVDPSKSPYHRATRQAALAYLGLWIPLFLIFVLAPH